jgi:hypothetical protein
MTIANIAILTPVESIPPSLRLNAERLDGEEHLAGLVISAFGKVIQQRNYGGRSDRPVSRP